MNYRELFNQQKEVDGFLKSNVELYGFKLIKWSYKSIKRDGETTDIIYLTIGTSNENNSFDYLNLKYLIDSVCNEDYVKISPVEDYIVIKWKV